MRRNVVFRNRCLKCDLNVTRFLTREDADLTAREVRADALITTKIIKKNDDKKNSATAIIMKTMVRRIKQRR